ncbi:hypothetical protein HGA88_05425 [Candidatus Roizmanbacteria bacterium]|nr:hypothetical protein [Candidatus Roizmanbacteria bacterium]
MIQPINEFIMHSVSRFFDFVPNLIGGVVVLLIGVILAGLLKKLLIGLLSFFRLATILQRMRLMNKNEVKVWEEVLAEVLRWSVIILFLIPTLEIWGLSRATGVINNFLLYLPNVIVTVVIGFVGLVVANLVSDLVRQSVTTLGETSANILAVVSKTIIIFFTVLVGMNQLGIAQDLIRILFTGIIAMVALAGGLSFGLGGQEVAKELLQGLKKKLSGK